MEKFLQRCGITPAKIQPCTEDQWMVFFSNLLDVYLLEKRMSIKSVKSPFKKTTCLFVRRSHCVKVEHLPTTATKEDVKTALITQCQAKAITLVQINRECGEAFVHFASFMFAEELFTELNEPKKDVEIKGTRVKVVLHYKELENAIDTSVKDKLCTTRIDVESKPLELNKKKSNLSDISEESLYLRMDFGTSIPNKDSDNSNSKFVQESCSLDPVSRRRFKECGCFKALETKYSSLLSLKYEHDVGMVQFEGHKSEVAAAKADVDLALLKLVKCIVDLGTHEKEFLLSTLDNEGTGVREIIQGIFRKNEILASLHIENQDCCLYFLPENDSGNKKLKEIVTAKKVHMSDDQTMVTTTKQWENFVESISDQHCKFFIDSENPTCLVVAGISSSIDHGIKLALDFIMENVIVTNIVSCSYPAALFLVNMDTTSLPHSKDIKWNVTFENGGGIEITGTKKEVDDACKLVAKTTSAYYESPAWEVRNAGFPDFFTSNENQSILTDIQKQTSTLILLDHNTFEHYNPNAKFKKITPSAKKVFDVKFQVFKEDILSHNCDIIVVPYSKNNTGICAALQHKGGKDVVESIEAIYAHDITEGNVFITTAGQISTCKEVVHAFVPERFSNNLENVNTCIQNAMEVMAHAKIVAFYALCYNLWSPEMGIPLLVQEIVSYLQQHKTSIKEVHFVGYDDDILRLFCNEISKVKDAFVPMQSPHNAVNLSQGPEVSSLTSGSSTRPSFGNQFNVKNTRARGVKIHVCCGDILEENTDVIVNSVSDTMEINNSGNLASALFQHGGNVVQTQFKDMKRKHASSTMRVTDGGNLPCDVIVHGATEKIGIQQLVFQSLQIAEDLGKSSVAIPALGTGGLNTHSSISASLIKKGITLFEKQYPTAVKVVKVVVYEKKMLDNFLSILGSTDTFLDGSIVLGPITLSVIHGNILEQVADVYVNSLGKYMDPLNSGKLSKDIFTSAGDKIKAQFMDTGRKFATKIMRVTEGGHLNCDIIIHGAHAIIGIKNFVTKSLEIAEDLQKSSIAFPAIGTGLANRDALSVGKNMRQGIEIFLRQNPAFVSSIKVVVLQHQMVQSFKNELCGRAYKIPRSDRLLPLKLNSVPPETNRNEVVTFYFCAKFQANVNQAQKQIEDLMKTHVETITISDPCLKQLDEDFRRELKDLKVIAVEINMSLGEIEVTAIKSDAIKAVRQVNAILEKFKDAVKINKRVQWSFVYPGDSTFNSFSLTTNAEMENSFEQNNDGQVTIHHASVTVDFRKELAVIGPQKFEIYRQDRQKNYPLSWCPMKRNHTLQLVNIEKDSFEFRVTLQQFSKGFTINEVIQLRRIQNTSQYEQFYAKKKEVENDLNKWALPHAASRKLFHGTSEDVTEHICREGFNRSFAGKNATVYGKGMYFAVSPKYPHEKNFASPNKAGVRNMFMVEVATGEYAPTRGTSDMLVPPLRQSGGNKEFYHSVVDNPSSPEIFVVFKDACAYPLYWLTYT